MPSSTTGSIRLSYLAAFKAAVEHGSLNQAANLLFLSQSALSQQIRMLESSLGAELVHRTSRGVDPTAEGHLFYAYCCRVLEETAVLERQLRACRNGQAEVWLGVETVLGEHLLPSVLSVFGEAHPEAGLHLSIDHTHEIVDAVRQGALHMGVVPDRQDDPNLTWTHLLDQPLLVICHPRHTLASKGEVELEELREHAYIAREPWTKCRQLNTRALANAGLVHDEMKIVAEMKTFAGKKSAVMANVGFGIAPWCGVWREISDGSLARVPLQGCSLSYPVYLVERSSAVTNSVQRDLKEFLLATDWSCEPRPLPLAEGCLGREG
jgi:LysR family transcriptional regulator, transcriptional activator of the cysJI operon